MSRPARVRRSADTTTVRFALWSARHPWWAIGGWVAVVLGCFVFGSGLGIEKATNAQLGVGESGRAAQMYADSGLTEADSEQVVISSTGSPGAGLAAAAADVSARMRALPQVSAVAPAVRSPDGNTVLVNVTLADGIDDPQPLLAATAATGRAYPNLVVGQLGNLSINAEVDSTLARDFQTALLISLPITLVILLVAFGALIAAGVPVLLGLTSVLSAVGLYTAASHLIPDGGSTAELILLVGMAVGVDYSLFYLKREREERALGRSAEAALSFAARTAGHAVVTSGVAVMVAMAGLYVIGDANFAAMATGAIAVVLLAVIGSLTVLPAVLALLGDKVDRPRVPLFWRISQSGKPSRVWPALLRPALRFPLLTLVAATGVMVALALPALDLKLKTSSEVDLPRSMPSMQAYDRLQAAFPAQRGNLAIVVQGPRGDVDLAVSRIRAAAARDSLFLSDPTVQAAGETSLILLGTPFPADSSQAAQALGQLRSSVIPGAAVPGVTVAVGGEIAGEVDYTDRMASRAPWVALFVLGLTFGLMTLAFRSVVVGVVTVLMNLLSAGAAFGILVLVFQHNWAASWLGFQPTGAVIAWIPVFLFVILFGLSMDYHVLVISRIREAFDRGLSPRDAVRDGITRSAGVVTSAAAVMIGVFAIFAGLSLVEFKELGIGLASAVFLDAVVVRILILPALMTLLGRFNWWAPKFLARPAPVSVGEPELVAVR